MNARSIVTRALALLALALALPHGARADVNDPHMLVVRGLVKGANGAPATGARIVARGTVNAETTTDDRGRYTLEVPLGSAASLKRGAFALEVRAEASNRRLALAGGAPALGLELTLAPGGTRVRVRSNLQDATTALASAYAQDGMTTAWIEADFGAALAGKGTLELRVTDEVDATARRPRALPQVPTPTVAPSARETARTAPAETTRRTPPAASATSATPSAPKPARPKRPKRTPAPAPVATSAASPNAATTPTPVATPPASAPAKSAKPAATSPNTPTSAAALAKPAATPPTSPTSAPVTAPATAQAPATPPPVSAPTASATPSDATAAPASTPTITAPAPASTSDPAPAGAIPVRASDPPAPAPRVVSDPRIKAIEPFSPPSAVILDTCACRVYGTVEIDWERPRERNFIVDVSLTGPAKQSGEVELFMGSPREFRLGPLPCGDYKLTVRPHGRVRYALRRGGNTIDVHCTGFTQVPVVLVPKR